MSGTAEVEQGSTIMTTYGGALAEAAAAAHLGSREQLGENLIRTFLTFWDNPELRPKLLEVFQSAASGGPGGAQMRDFMTSQFFAQVGKTLDGEPLNIDQVAEMLKVPALNINAAVAQVMGTILLRYVLKMEPIASASADEVVSVLAPTIQRYLVG